MRRIFTILVCGVSLNLILINSFAFAVYNGTETKSDAVAVPIIAITDASSVTNNGTQCSGSLISEYVVVTSAHCVVTKNLVVSPTIYVDAPGSDTSYDPNWIKVSKVRIPDSWQNDSVNNRVSPNDIAFLNLEKPIQLKQPVRIASEDEIQQWTQSGRQIRLTGYGLVEKDKQTTFPNYVDATLLPSVLNFGTFKLTGKSACSGDSGSPITTVFSNTVVVLGIQNGSESLDCSSSLANRTTSHTFTLINRFSDLLFESLSDSLAIKRDQLNKANEELGTTKYDLIETEGKLEALESELGELRIQYDLIKSQLDALPKISIKCFSGKKRITVKDINPICPKGFKRVK